MSRIEHEPQPLKETAWQRFAMSLGLQKRNEQDALQELAADLNKPHREAERRRRERQP